MIESTDIIAKIGKKKFAEFATSQQKGKRMIDLERGRRWGTNIKYRMCEHGVFVIDNYKPKRCKSCIPETSTKLKDFEPHFNLGLGCYVESKSEMNRVAKQKGLIAIGSDRR